MGRELNPSIGSLDLKSFCEMRPGLIGWVIINISMACEQATRNGGRITDSMALIVLFQGAYVLDALYNEVRAVTFVAAARAYVSSACYPHHNGHHDGRIWVHVDYR